MKIGRIMSFPIIFLILEPWFIWWYLSDMIKGSRSKHYITQQLWTASAKGHWKQRGKMYRAWVNGEPSSEIFSIQKKEKV